MELEPFHSVHRFKALAQMIGPNLSLHMKCVSIKKSGNEVYYSLRMASLTILLAAATDLSNRDIFIDNLLVRVHWIIEMIVIERPCAMGV